MRGYSPVETEISCNIYGRVSPFVPIEQHACVHTLIICKILKRNSLFTKHNNNILFSHFFLIFRS